MSVRWLSSEELAARTRRAVAAASAAARELGLHVAEARVLHDMFSVVVHLAPSPVVARVPLVLPPGLDASAQLARQRRELSVVGWLGDAGYPVVRPSPLVPREPVQHGGWSMTFWQLVEVDVGAPADSVAQAPLAVELHAALRGYPRELPFLSPLAGSVPASFARFEQSPELIAPADFARALEEWAVLAPLLESRESFAAAFPDASLQAIHGDAPTYNFIHTTSGLRYADFEDTTFGPVEWDLALLGPDAAAAYDRAATRAGVRRLDPSLLALMDRARMLQFVACLALVPELPQLAAGLAPSLAAWRALPLGGNASTG
jgi:aminoglycoside phosphotransferase (APT) family kinase protein